ADHVRVRRGRGRRRRLHRTGADHRPDAAVAPGGPAGGGAAAHPPARPPGAPARTVDRAARLPALRPRRAHRRRGRPHPAGPASGTGLPGARPPRSGRPRLTATDHGPRVPQPDRARRALRQRAQRGGARRPAGPAAGSRPAL
ncbi:MAG: Sporulation and cell division protein SsgA, partial [uncultured Frankineae bacterium]